MNEKRKSRGAKSSPKDVSAKKAKVVRLEDLVPKQDLRAGRRVVFGNVQVNTVLKNQ